MTAIINHQVLSDPSEWTGVEATYTHSCGFVRAWLDPYDRLLVWYYTACPVDAVITQVQVLISDFVTSAIAALTHLDAPDSDTHLRLLKVIADVKAMVVEWLNDTNTTEEIAQFLQAENRIQTYIVNELITQGVIA